MNPKAQIILGESPISVENPKMVKDKRVLVVEDGPTLTHGEMPYGAGSIAADRLYAEKVDPRPQAMGTIKETFEKYNHLGPVLPAMGYSDVQLQELEDTIDKTDCDVVLLGTPIDLRRVIKINKPATRVYYDLKEVS